MKRSAKSTTPYSAVGEIGTSVPALKHFFRCLERPGDTTMYDSKGGVVWHPYDVAGYGLDFDVNGTSNTVCPVGIAETIPAPITGDWHIFDHTKACLVVVSAQVFKDPSITKTDTRFALGNVNTFPPYEQGGIGLSNGPFHFVYKAGGPGTTNTWTAHASLSLIPSMTGINIGDVGAADNTRYKKYPDGTAIGSVNTTYFEYKDLDPTLAFEPHDILLVGYKDFDQSGMYKCTELSTQEWYVYTWLAPQDNTVNTSLVVQPCMRVSNLAMYGAAIFEFDQLPADHELACTWMAQEWKRGNRVIWPGWVGKS